MYIARMLIAAVLVFLLQVTIVHNVSLLGATPDLVLVLLVIFVIDRKPVLAVIIGFLLGFLQDLGNASFLGMNALAKSVIAFGIARFASGYLPESILFKGLLIFLAALVSDIIVLNITASFHPGAVLLDFFRYSIVSALYTSLIGIAVFGLLRLVPGRRRRSVGRY
ncbi:MAG TPA: rod shape-determining protein MreD [Candidatus Krumholzibacterium sp.]|nr:rod shape-determining protein MreD [Candidatus Krumholzibacterium sp.]